MCGIVGATSERRVTGILLEGLKRLEYRGYDSAGVAVLDADKHLKSVRRTGTVQELKDAKEEKRARDAEKKEEEDAKKVEEELQSVRQELVVEVQHQKAPPPEPKQVVQHYQKNIYNTFHRPLW